MPVSDCGHLGAPGCSQLTPSPGVQRLRPMPHRLAEVSLPDRTGVWGWRGVWQPGATSPTCTGGALCPGSARRLVLSHLALPLRALLPSGLWPASPAAPPHSGLSCPWGQSPRPRGSQPWGGVSGPKCTGTPLIGTSAPGAWVKDADSRAQPEASSTRIFLGQKGGI